MTMQKKINKYIKNNKKGQGALLATIIGSVIMSTIIASSTQWYLSMHRNIDGLDDRLEAMSIAMSEWQRLEHMSIDELINSQESLKEPYKVSDKFKVAIHMGEKGYFDNGKCNVLKGEYASESPNCFSDTTMTVYDRNNNALYTTRSLPLSSSTATQPIPDWAKATIVNKINTAPIDYTFKVPANGIVLYSVGGNVGGFSSQRVLSINGKEVYGENKSNLQNIVSGLQSGHGRGDLDNTDSSFLMVAQGDVLRFQVSNTSNASWNALKIKFVPYKGARFINVNNDISSDSPSGSDISTNNGDDSILPIGTILPYSGSLAKIPSGWHLCDGTAGTPDMRNRFLMGWGSNGVGSYVSAGLPNITGNMTPKDSNPLLEMLGESYFNFDGAFQGIWGITGATADGSDYGNMVRGIRFNASWSNPIYGNSTTVQPPSYVVYYIMKIK